MIQTLRATQYRPALGWLTARWTGVTDPVRIPGATYRFSSTTSSRSVTPSGSSRTWTISGITDLYASPFLKAGPDSLHGYDVSNHNEINPAIGTPDDYAALSAALRERGMSQLLDVVPNHMGVGSNLNDWWNDVLENGPISTYAPYFDIDWSPLQTGATQQGAAAHPGRPVRARPGKRRAAAGLPDGAFFLEYYEHILPSRRAPTPRCSAGPCDRLSHVRPSDDPVSSSYRAS